jgi:HSP20 family protein
MTLYTYALPHRMARRWLTSAGDGRSPRLLPVNIRDEGEAFELTAAVPGLKAEDLHVQVLEDVVRIEGEFAADENEYLVHEVSGGGFRRELRLPSALEADKVEAKIADGMLVLRLPKAESSRPKTIKVATK